MTITDSISDATHDLIYASAGLVVVDSKGVVSAWKRLPGLIRQGNFSKQGEFGAVLADRNSQRYKEAVKLLQSILITAKSTRGFDEQICLGMYIDGQQVHRIGFGHAGWYPTGVIPAGELRLV